jgi:hypothetical protein
MCFGSYVHGHENETHRLRRVPIYLYFFFILESKKGRQLTDAD